MTIVFFFVFSFESKNSIFFDVQNLIQFEFWLKFEFEKNDEFDFENFFFFRCIFKIASIMFISFCRWTLIKFGSKMTSLWPKSLILNSFEELDFEFEFFSNFEKSTSDFSLVIKWDVNNIRKNKKNENVIEKFNFDKKKMIWFSKNEVIEWFFEKIKRFKIEFFENETDDEISIRFLIEKIVFFREIKKKTSNKSKLIWFDFEWFDFCLVSKKTDNSNFFSKIVRFFRKAILSIVQSIEKLKSNSNESMTLILNDARFEKKIENSIWSK